MEPGDFASVPPNIVHQYQILGDHNEFMGLIVPGGWEEFFRFIGDPYSGPMWPNEDNRDVFEVLIPRLQQAKDKYDYVPLPDHPYFGPQPWDPASDSSLPGTHTPYFLQAGRGPRYTFAGTVVSPLITTAESNGIFAVGSIEGSSYHEGNPLSRAMTWDQSHHCFYVVDGYLEVVVNGEEAATIGSTELMYIPKQTTFSIRFGSRYVKAYVFSNKGGILEALCKIGTRFDHPMIPERPLNVDAEQLTGLEASMNFRFLE
ncbi:hypothetical protein CLAIMM_08435 [Cladophialophora immunda]|nr:hypothetical protein CLAIMM_08435 [Cladophialophora immunda]